MKIWEGEVMQKIIELAQAFKDGFKEPFRMVARLVRRSSTEVKIGSHEVPAGGLLYMPVCANSQATKLRGGDSDGYQLVPVTPTTALLRPFLGCPEDELELAWQAMILIASKMPTEGSPAQDAETARE